MSDIASLCGQFARMLGGDMSVKQGTCTVERSRPHIQATIGNKSAGLIMNSDWSFQSLDREGRALNLGETALLEEEVYSFTQRLLRHGIAVSAVHNHWLMDRPKVIYVHYMTIGDPLVFAAGVADAYSVLR